jgi:hypothetical protein
MKISGKISGKISRTARKMTLLAAVVGTCLVGANPSSAVLAVHAIAHREPTHVAGGAPRRVPYAPPLKSVPATMHRPVARPALRENAIAAEKHWEHTGWVKTGAIERHHFWLTRPFDHIWHDRGYFYRPRWWWWHHHHLWQLLWLGQGWAYWHGWYYGHWITTQPSVIVSQSTNVVADAGPSVSVATAVAPSDLALRNQALDVLDGLQLTDNQFDVVHGALDHLSLAGDPVDADVINTAIDKKADCVAAIHRLYADSASGNDEQAALDMDQVYKLEDKYEINFDPTVVVSDDARVQAKVIFDVLTPRQIAQYLAVRGQVVPDPSQILLSALDQCRHLTDADFEEYSRCLAERLVVLTHGLDSPPDDTVERQVKALLRDARPLSDEEFASQKDDLRSRSEQAVACDPIELIHHAVEWDLANFMANPQAKAMSDMRARQVQAPS